MYVSRIALFVHLHHSIQSAAESCAELANSPIAQRRMFVNEFRVEILKHASTILRANRLDCDCMIDHAAHSHHFRTPLTLGRADALHRTEAAASMTRTKNRLTHTQHRPHPTSVSVGNVCTSTRSSSLCTRAAHAQGTAKAEADALVHKSPTASVDNDKSMHSHNNDNNNSSSKNSSNSVPRDIADDLHYLRDLCHRYLLPSALAPLRLDVAYASLHALLHEPDPIALPKQSWLVSSQERQPRMCAYSDCASNYHGHPAYHHCEPSGSLGETNGVHSGERVCSPRLGNSHISTAAFLPHHTNEDEEGAAAASAALSHNTIGNDKGTCAYDVSASTTTASTAPPSSHELEETFHGRDMCAVRTPLGLVALLSRYRPRMSIEAVAMGLLAGNALLVDGGAALYHTNVEIAHCIRTALRRAGLPVSAVAHVMDGADDGMAQLTREWLQQSYVQHTHCAPSSSSCCSSSSMPVLLEGDMMDGRDTCRDGSGHSVPHTNISSLPTTCTRTTPTNATGQADGHSHTRLPSQSRASEREQAAAEPRWGSSPVNRRKGDAAARQHCYDACPHYIDAALVCGPPKLYRFACQHSVAIPLINATTSGCSIYVDHSAGFDLVLRTVLEVTRTQTRLRQFGAMDTLIIHAGFPRAAELLNYLAHEGGVRLRGDEAAREAAPRAVLELATDEDYRGESYLASSLTSVASQSSYKYSYGDLGRTAMYGPDHYNTNSARVMHSQHSNTSSSEECHASCSSNSTSTSKNSSSLESQGDGGVSSLHAQEGARVRTCDERHGGAHSAMSALPNSHMANGCEFDHNSDLHSRGGLLCVKMVPSLQYAIYLLKNLGYHEGATIISSDERMMREFCRRVDSAMVSVNTSISRASAVAAEQSGANLALSSCKLLGCGPITLTTFTTTKCVVRVSDV